MYLLVLGHYLAVSMQNNIDNGNSYAYNTYSSYKSNTNNNKIDTKQIKSSKKLNNNNNNKAHNNTNNNNSMYSHENLSIMI